MPERDTFVRTSICTFHADKRANLSLPLESVVFSFQNKPANASYHLKWPLGKAPSIYRLHALSDQGEVFQL